jgi:hypothetical protein
VPIRLGHYKTWSRWTQAVNVHSILKDPNSDCRYYVCEQSTSDLQVCWANLEGQLVAAVQWVYNDGAKWLEGTAYIQDKPNKVSNTIRNNKCREVGR